MRINATVWQILSVLVQTGHQTGDTHEIKQFVALQAVLSQGQDSSSVVNYWGIREIPSFTPYWRR